MSFERDMVCNDIESDIIDILGGMREDKDGCMCDPYDGYMKSCGDLEINFLNKEDFNTVWTKMNDPNSEYGWLKRRLITYSKERNSMRFDLD